MVFAILRANESISLIRSFVCTNTHKKKYNKRKRQRTIKFVFGDPLTDVSVHGRGKLNSQGTLSAGIIMQITKLTQTPDQQDCYDQYL